jgi:hypothetical protein
MFPEKPQLKTNCAVFWIANCMKAIKPIEVCEEHAFTRPTQRWQKHLWCTDLAG